MCWSCVGSVHVQLQLPAQAQAHARAMPAHAAYAGHFPSPITNGCGLHATMWYAALYGVTALLSNQHDISNWQMSIFLLGRALRSELLHEFELVR